MLQINVDSNRTARVLFTGVGATLILLGVTGAVMSIPQDFSPRGALTASGAILTMAMIAPTIPSWRNDIRSLLRGENVLIAALIYWTLLDVLQGAYSLPVSREAVVAEYLLLGTTALGFWVGANLGKPLAPRLVMREGLNQWSKATTLRLLALAFALGLWDFLYRSDFDIDLILQSLTASRWATPWQRESLGDWSAFSYHLQYFGYLVPAMAVLLALRAGWRNPLTWVGIAMSLVILAFHAQGGGRRIVGAMILAGIFCWLIYVRRLNTRRFAVVTVAVVSLAALMQLMLVFRGVGFGDEGSALAQYDYLHVDDNFLRIAQMLEFVPESHPFVGFQYVIYAIIRPVPRVLWAEKPADGGFDLAALLGIPDTSFALTMAGELYVSFGYTAAFLGSCVYGRLSSMVNALFEFPAEAVNPIFPSLLLVWLFVGVRSMLEIMLMGYVVLAVILLSKLGRFVQSLRSGAGKSHQMRRGI
jgi:oligosaccharide repeat unit polymerase